MDRRHLRHMGRLARIFWAYRRGASKVPQLPVRLWIESTSRCNLKCGYCPYKDVVKADEIVNELRPVLQRFVKERKPGERFGDFTHRVILCN
mgnify:CR=1 FL=1